MNIDLGSADADQVIAWARSLNWPHRALPAIVEKLQDLDEKRRPYEGRKDLTASAQRTFDRLRTESQKLSAFLPELEEERDVIGNSRKQLHGGGRVSVGNEAKTYRPDRSEFSFFADLMAARRGNSEAQDRLERNRRESAEFQGIETRDMSVTSTQGGDFLPPMYLDAQWVEPNIGNRPFADAVNHMPLPPDGIAVSIPQLSSGVSVAERADLGAVSEVDGVTASISHSVREFSGQVDIGRIALSRSQPGLDQVIMRTLVRRYNAALDTQLLSGPGTGQTHLGIRAVSGISTTTFTSPVTAAACLPKIYDAIQKVATVRQEEYADLIVFHPRRAAWLASNLSSTFPLFQQGMLNQAAGSQDGGFANNLAGLKVVLDPNVGVTYGAATNEDEIYVVNSNDLILMESPLQMKVFEDVGSGNGIIRLQVFAYSAFLSSRYPGSISKVNGAGLVTPVFS